MAGIDEKDSKLKAVDVGTEDSGSGSTSGVEEVAEEDNQEGDTERNDTGGGAISSSSSSGHEQNNDQVGDTGLNEEQQVYEGVKSQDFEVFAEDVEGHLDGLTASSVVIVVALFVNAGILAVSTLLRSLERG